MPKNVGGGKRYKKRKNKGPAEPGPIMYADSEQEYGIVTKRLGNGLLELMISKDCNEPRRALGKIRGILRKRRVPFNVGSIVIVSGRDCLTSKTVGVGDNVREKVDVLHCYYEDQAKRLYRENKIPRRFQLFVDVEKETKDSGNGAKEDQDEDVGFVFEDEDDAPAEAVDIDDL